MTIQEKLLGFDKPLRRELWEILRKRFISKPPRYGFKAKQIGFSDLDPYRNIL